MDAALRYRELLVSRFGADTLIGAYLGSRPTEHRCRACGYEFRASPKRILAGGLCLWCTRAADPAGKAETAGTVFNSAVAAKWDHVSCTKFSAVSREAEFECWCGTTWTDKPRNILKRKDNPCPGCSVRPKFDAQGKLHVHSRTGRLWKSESGGKSSLRCWCGTNIQIPTKLISSPAIECPTCLGLCTEDAIQTAYKFRTLDHVSWHVNGEVNVPQDAYGWEEARVKAKQILKEGYAPVISLGSEYMPQGAHTWKRTEVEAWRRQSLVKGVTVLSLDPGVTNCAWSVLEAGRTGMPKLLATGMIRNTIKEFTGDDLESRSKLFSNEIQQLVEEFSVTHLIAERFMSRGMKGLTIELVNAMLGILINLWAGAPGSMKFITAAQWKNEWNRNSDLTAYYSRCACEVHQVDSIGIGLYGIDHWFNRKPFENIRSLEKRLVKQINLRNFG